MNYSGLRFFSRRLSVCLAVTALATSVFGHTITVASISESEGMWSNTYPNSGNPLSSFGPIGNWTFQTAGSGGGLFVNFGQMGIAASGANSAPVTFTWNLVWTPSNPTDIPNSPTVVVQQRYEYQFGALIASMPLGLPGQSWPQFTDANGGLTDVGDPIQGNTNLNHYINQTTWVNGLLLRVGSPWTLQANGTYTSACTFTDSYLTTGMGSILSPNITKSLQLMFSTSYTIQTTLISVADVNFTPWL